MIQKAFAITKIHKIISLPLMPRRAVNLPITNIVETISLPLMSRRAVNLPITKIEKTICLPLMPRRAVTFANHSKSNQKRFGTRRQNHSAQANAQPQLSRSKQRQTRQRSNSGAVLPRVRDRSAYAGDSQYASR